MNFIHSGIRFLVPFAMLSFTSAAAWGVAFTWNDSSGGLFDDPANWTPAGGPPGSGEDALFNLANTYTVTFQSDVTNATSTISNGTVSFQLSGTTHTLTA